MINNDQSTLLLYCCEDLKSHRSGGDIVQLIILALILTAFPPRLLLAGV